jgi:hypothetical protein
MDPLRGDALKTESWDGSNFVLRALEQIPYSSALLVWV